MRKLLLIAPLFLIAAAPPPPPAPPIVGVKSAMVSGARRVDAVLPGRLLATAFPRGTDGHRKVVALLDTHEIYLIETAGPGSQRRLLSDLPDKAATLLAADLDGDGADEILLGAPGKVWTLGTPDAPSAPHPVFEGVDAHHLLGLAGAAEIAAPEVGRLRTWSRGGGQLVPGPSYDLPVRARRQRTAIRLETPDVDMLPQGEGAPPLYLAGPEENGKTRLHTLLLTRGADGNPQRTEAWSRLSGPSELNDHQYLRVDGRPLLLVTTTGADKVSIFEKKRLLVFPLTADRTRAGQNPLLSSPTDSPRWFPVEPAVADLDRDGREDLVVVQQQGLLGKSLRVEAWFGQGQGHGRFELPSRKTEIDLQARAWYYGPDLTGDGRPDLLAIQQNKLYLYPGTADPRRAPIERKPHLTLDLPATEAVSIESSAGTAGVVVNAQRSKPLETVDLDGDGRPEIVVTVRDDQGRGRVTLVSTASRP